MRHSSTASSFRLVFPVLTLLACSSSSAPEDVVLEAGPHETGSPDGAAEASPTDASLDVVPDRVAAEAGVPEGNMGDAVVLPPPNCGPDLACLSGTICVMSQHRAPDGGADDAGGPPIYTCPPLPAACGGTPSCTCAPSVCIEGYSCTSATKKQITCT